jgi:predicted transcriptional regulator
MNKLNNLTSILNIIENTSRDILSKAVPIMKDLKNTDSEMVDEVMEYVKDESTRTVLEVLQNICLDLVEDAEKVVLEIEAFSDAVVQGEEVIEEREEEYLFLMEVWCGDIYEKEKLAGLKELAKELKNQLKEVSENKIVEHAINKLKKNKSTK